MYKKIIVIFFVIFALVVACAINPVTGKNELMLISESQEIQMGKETDQAINMQFGYYDDPALTKYVRRLGQSLVSHTHRPNLTYHFAVLDTPVVNAFAAPGGYIYVTRGALALMRSEAELVTILGHELGHVNARHSARKMSQLLLAQVGLVVGSALSETFRDLSGAASIGVQLLFLKFSRNDEYQADTLGVEYSRKALFHPGKMIDFFASLQKMGDLSGGSSIPGFLSTHPLTAKRISEVGDMLTGDDMQLTINKNPYMNRINNLVYGDDPRQGFVEANTFYHPLMRFSFSIPQGWKFQNQRTQVTLVSPDDNAAIILQAEQSSQDLRNYATQRAQKLEGATYLGEQSLQINGLQSYQQLYEIPQQDQQPLKMRVSYIRKNDFIYAFSAFSTSQNYGNYDFQFGTIIGSFRQLNDRRYLDRKPNTLKVIKADGRKTLQQYFQQARINKELWPRFAIMNGLELGDVPQRNQLIKIL
ncbi:M48 family metalloprotease [Acidobacteriota bacterium]